MNAFIETLEQYGATLGGLRLFDDDEPALLPYATLVSARGGDGSHKNFDLAALYGVYEWQENPLIFLINGDELVDEAHFRRIRRRVALRGDAPYLGVVRPGQLTVHRLSLDRATAEQSQISLNSSGWSKRATFSRLANERPDATASKREWVSDVVLSLLRDAIRRLAGAGICNENAVSLAGRALFIRFLADRDLLQLPLVPSGETDSTCLFDDPHRAETTSQWLDETFNGDFLPLNAKVFEQLSKDACKTLGDIARRAKGGQLYLGWEHKWDYLDFAHIPVGVLSQAYEHYMREHLPEKQRKEGGYYTPRTIVELMVRGAFHALRREGTAPQARVLDPAAGAGVFLIASFRQLVMEQWMRDGKRPDTGVLRDILYHQIVGFDINEEALRFAALGLYLISIELDPCPQPVEKLRFEKNLRGSVLHKVADDSECADDDKSSRSLGSLGARIGSEHVGQYDLVIGNPPWPTGTKLPNWSEVKQVVSRIAKNRLPEGAPAPPLPNEPLDLPFVWRAMEWAKAEGQIAFALHARILFQQGEGMPEARRAIFSALDVTGVLNGAEVCETQVWPGISAPFCLLFAKNRLPPPGAGFRFVSPHVETSLNRTGVLRVDASNAEVVTAQQIAEQPEILKILFRGTSLDLEVFERMASSGLKTLESYWKVISCKAGNGYQKLRKSSRIRKNSEDHLPGVSAAYLKGLRELAPEATKAFLVDASKLHDFTHKRIHDPRPRSLFQGPLLIIHKSPPAAAGRIRVAVADNDLMFNETYYGYSAWGHEYSHRLVRYLALLIGSKPALWYLLMTSGEFGVERRVVEKIIIDKIPVVPFEELNISAREQINLLFEALAHEDSEENWERVDAWAAGLFNLRKRDLQVIADTLKYNLPFARNREAAQAQPSREEVEIFCRALSSELEPWARRMGADIKIQPVRLPALSPWEVLHIHTSRSSISCSSRQFSGDWPEILQVADRLGTTEVLMPDETDNGLWIARLKQARYWSRSQARLVARRIVWEHLGVVFGRSKAS